jgi:hypothetical protein
MRKGTARWGLSTAVLVAAGLALTACGPNGSSSAAGSSSSSSAPTSAAQPGTQAPADSGQGSAGASPSGAPTSGSDGSGVANAGDQRTIVGTLEYLAPGKMLVKPQGGGAEVAFLASNATKILGAAAICSDTDGRVTIGADGYGTSKCTEDQLEKAAKTNSVTVRVTMDRKSGGAETVEEKYHP